MENDSFEINDLNEVNEADKANKKRSILKIIVPLLILLIIAGIWFVKESQRASDEEAEGDKGVVVTENEDFELYATEDFDLEKLKSYGLPIMIDFGSASCPPCREMAPVLKKVHGDVLERAIVKYVDVDSLQTLTADYPIRVVPTQLFFDKDGNPFMPVDPEGSQMLIYTTRDTGEHVLTSHEGALTESRMLEIFAEMGMEE
ncbi:thioredoxin family protein [Bacillota bacterium]